MTKNWEADVERERERERGKERDRDERGKSVLTKV